jgi:MFS family permease
MQKKDTFTKGLAIVGTALACFPILMTLLTSLASPFIAGRFLMDYLMPAELGLFALGGALLLLWAAFRARSRRGLIGGALGFAIVMLVGGQAIAEVTGLASGETEIGGWQWVLVLTTLALYIGALIVIDISGILLSRDLLRSTPPAVSS